MSKKNLLTSRELRCGVVFDEAEKREKSRKRTLIFRRMRKKDVNEMTSETEYR